MAAELNKDISEEDAESYKKLEDDLEVVIKEMQAQMGRFPTRDEVVNFVWGDSQARDDILNKGLSDG